MADPVLKPRQSDIYASFAPTLTEAGERGSAALIRANDLIVKAVQKMWECQTDLFRLEAEQAAKTFVTGRTSGNQKVPATEYLDQWHEGAEKVINHVRAMNDLVRGCHWQLLNIYLESLERNLPSGRAPEV